MYMVVVKVLVKVLVCLEKVGLGLVFLFPLVPLCLENLELLVYLFLMLNFLKVFLLYYLMLT
ncbi:hypothetical protein GLOIN_2v1695950 [Rhizophagus irregularis DAOM 181602=DAOM 197198]|uniref:Uncharacterized protein n=1 Tax=Rhizophagus irregularis (strain DAOM 181602 / DAOM 197198 / MUCL 43194) TaxID=747089 RepID=A0A2P4PAQ3_RHIID|nr:hypothetical protein GLOIN_2v1695950 [Rhizophagus irregularis DAOM 181602=DAOM 197198]POG62479.1 hypothetical protein GLOIN_2v1695950 [Rhizophagus irregularis DAOM 181602=DAOM 197198]|eukprot:XP_025169345.1 hypothetical protein GLOIN_2v1695950 [Rhizophagus irregularis DAOM 181602=DAOM 197198]